MLNQKSDPMYVSWADVFHPETAEASLNPTIKEEQQGNKWGAVFAEAVLVSDPCDPESDSAVASIVTDEEAAASGSTGDNKLPEGGNAPDPDTTSSSTVEASCPHRGPGFFEIIIGGTIALAAVVSAFAFELAAAIVYILAVSFQHLCDILNQIGGLAHFFRAIFLLVVWILMFVDALLLTLSVFVAELLAVVASLLCCLFGGCYASRLWHQHIRKLCHLARWGFRDFHDGWKPERVFPLGAGNNEKEDEGPGSLDDAKACTETGGGKLGSNEASIQVEFD